MNADFIVTPWEVKGKIDYDKLIRDFGTQYISEELINKVAKYTGAVHTLFRRKVFFSHRDFNWILDKYEKGEKFALYTGRGPSGHTHIGHLVPWLMTQHLQEKFGADLYFQMTDDEKFLHDINLNLKTSTGFTYENALDVIACGFKPEKTFIFSDIEYAKTNYSLAIQIAKNITYSTVKSIFGFNDSINIGMIFFPAIQAAPCFLPSILKQKKIPILIPAAIDQDNYWRGIARAVAPKLGFYKPAQIHSKFLPGLGKWGKMSSSEPETAIFTVDNPEIASKKVMNAFTCGRSTVEEQRKLGGQADICPVYQYFLMLMEPDDQKLQKKYSSCKSGELLCGECKANLSEKVKKFLIEHQRKREKAKDNIYDFMLRD